MIALYDLDSTIYLSVYKIVQIFEIKEWFYQGRSREWMETEIVNLSINRMTQITGNVFIEIEETGIVLSEIRYYITQAQHPIRNWIYPNYKSNRRKNKWVSLVRKELIKMDFANVSDIFEADDLIVDDAKEIGSPNFLIISQDKDYDQIEGVRFNDKRPRPPKGEEFDVNGFRRKLPCKGLTFVTAKEAKYNFYHQVLTGDSGDNIKGCEGIGKVKATKLLKDRKNLLRASYEPYIKKYGDNAKFEYWKNYFLIKLTTKR